MFCENIDIVRSGPSMVVANSDILPECVFETNIYLGGERKHILVRYTSREGRIFSSLSN